MKTSEEHGDHPGLDLDDAGSESDQPSDSDASIYEDCGSVPDFDTDSSAEADSDCSSVSQVLASHIQYSSPRAHIRSL